MTATLVYRDGEVPAKSPAFQFYSKEWLSSSKARLMGAYGRGVYVDLLCRQWEDGSIPDDVEAVAALVGEPIEEVTKVWPRVRACFTKSGASLKNERLEKTRREMKRFRTQKIEAGRQSGIARRRNAKERKEKDVEQNANRTRTKGEPASASASELQDLNPRTTPDRIARARESTEVQTEGEKLSSEDPASDRKVIGPPLEVLAKMGAAVLGVHPERVEIKHRNTSAPDPDSAHGTFMRFIQPFNFDTASVLRWQGRITEQRRGVAVREIQRGTYRGGEGRECRWQDLSDDSRRKVVLKVFNGMVP